MSDPIGRSLEQGSTTAVIDFELTSRQRELKARTEAFIRDKVIPLEHQGEPQRIEDDFRR